MIGITSFSTNSREVRRTSFSSSFSCESKSMKSTPENPGMRPPSFLRRDCSKRILRAATGVSSGETGGDQNQESFEPGKLYQCGTGEFQRFNSGSPKACKYAQIVDKKRFAE